MHNHSTAYVFSEMNFKDRVIPLKAYNYTISIPISRNLVFQEALFILNASFFFFRLD